MSADRNRQGAGRWWRWARDLALVFAVVLLFQWWQTRDLASGPAPVLRGQMLGGESLDLSELRGKPVLVHFWATWCPVCRTQDGSIHNLAKDYQVLSIASSSGDAGQVRQYLDREALDFPVMLDETGELGNRWGVRGFPSSFIIDSSGEIRSIAVGYTTEIGLRMRLWLAGWS